MKYHFAAKLNDRNITGTVEASDITEAYGRIELALYCRYSEAPTISDLKIWRD